MENALSTFVEKLVGGLAAQAVVGIVALLGIFVPRIRAFLGGVKLSSSILFILGVFAVSVALLAIYLAAVTDLVIARGTIVPDGKLGLGFVPSFDVNSVGLTITQGGPNNQDFTFKVPDSKTRLRTFVASSFLPSCVAPSVQFRDNNTAVVAVTFPLGPPTCPDQTLQAHKDKGQPLFRFFVFETTGKT